MKPLAWDIDDTLGDCALAWTRWLSKNGYGQFTHEDFKTYRLCETFKCSDAEALERLARFLDSDEINQMPAYPEALSILQKFSHVTHHAVTGRPLTTQKATRSWLDTNFPNQFKQLHMVGADPMKEGLTAIGNTGKAAACKQLGADILIEDAPMFVHACLEADITVVLIEKPWNRNVEFRHPLLHRVKNLAEVSTLLEKLL